MFIHMVLAMSWYSSNTAASRRVLYDYIIEGRDSNLGKTVYSH
jgi:hypothetical protein